MKRLTKLLVGLGSKKSAVSGASASSSIDLLRTQGYIHKSTSGTYDILPLGLLVQSNIERIVRKHLDSVGGVELSLATLQSLDLWKQSGRYRPDGSELFVLPEKNYLLAPTAEEEVTSLVSQLISSHKQLPLLLYQISKKYRDELRPRGGLLRTKEFVMKDLYSFDATKDQAIASYKNIQQAYVKIFQEIGVSARIAEADSGTIGGDLSHEFHLLSEAGEDNIVHCDSCGYTANSEAARDFAPKSQRTLGEREIKTRYFLTEDHENVVACYFPHDRVLNHLTIPEEIGMGLSETEATPSNLKRTLNTRLFCLIDQSINPEHSVLPEPPEEYAFTKTNTTKLWEMLITEPIAGDECGDCAKPLKISKAIEVGHTFYLGTKYSSKFDTTVLDKDQKHSLVEMGCYGIGISRLISAVAEVTHDERGLNWPKNIAPFHAVLVSRDEHVAEKIHNALASKGLTSVLDDRSSQIGTLLGAAPKLGIPLLIIAGKAFRESGKVEVQLRNGESVETTLQNVGETASSLLAHTCT